jgi:high-affinity iron transporter
VLLLALPATAGARASSAQRVAPALGAAEGQALHRLLAVLPARYASAQPTHDLRLAALTRVLARGVQRRTLELRTQLATRDPARTAQAVQALARLETLLGSTTQRFQPWPLALEVSALSTRAQRQLDAILPLSKASTHVDVAIGAAFQRAEVAARVGRESDASFALLGAYALYASGPGQRLQIEDPSLDAQITRELLPGDAGSASASRVLASPASLARAAATVRLDLGLAAQALGEVRISHTTIVINGAIIVFREGLEAVLIIAAITASFVGARRRLRRPVLIGALAGVGATALTWIVAQMMLHLLGDGGLRLQAITGLIAIAVLLLVTNWFFHRLYWSEWIARFNRRRRALERWDGLGFVSGQVLGFVLLGLSSVYREGLETVLFLQALQTSAGTGATVLGAGIGLGATLVVGAITFKLQRKLPFKRMLILTGVLIALVLAVMVGTTVHNMQGIGWLPSTPTSFAVPTAWSTWLGAYATWEGIVAQIGSLVFVFGSYFVAREIQVKRPQRRAVAAPVAVPRPSA